MSCLSRNYNEHFHPIFNEKFDTDSLEKVDSIKKLILSIEIFRDKRRRKQEICIEKRGISLI